MSTDLDDPDSKQVIKMVFRNQIATTPVSILVESLVKNFCAMIETDEEHALKIYNQICNKLFEMKLIDESYHMREFEGMRSQYQRALYHLVTAAREGEEPAVQRMWPNINAEWSHYQREFDEIEYIAGGGFGQVFLVRHKLDGTEYAVKKIYIRSNGIESVMNYLTEVKTFASLNHSNIVQYKAAWLELGIPTSKKAIRMSNNHYSSYLTRSKQEAVSNIAKAQDYSELSNYSKLHDFKPHDSTTESNSNSKSHNTPPNLHSLSKFSLKNPSIPKTLNHSSNFTVQFESLKSKQYSKSNNNICSKRSSRESRNSISEGGKGICKFNFEEARNFERFDRPPEQQWATLFIQMALCQITLKQWLEQRNVKELKQETNEVALVVSTTKRRREMIIEILQQLLRGLDYIHAKGIVHHDIKPSNIFMQLDGGKVSVQLGDFGLACPLQSSCHSLAFGTKLYAAPEQLEGMCNSKSDLYSLGIVLLELVETFRTDMERVHHITALRNGRLSAQISAQEPQLAHIISQLVSKLPSTRPTATELLNRLTAQDSEQIRDLRTQLAEKDVEIDRLKRMLVAAGVQF